MVENHVNIDFLNFLFIKTISDIFYLYSSIFLVKSFQVCLISSDDDNFDNNINNIDYKNFVDSDVLINWCSNEFFNLCLSLNFVLQIEIDVYLEKIRDIFIKIFFICSLNNLIFEQNIFLNKKKTYKLYYINILFNIDNINVKVYDKSFKIFENSENLYLFCGHFSSIVEVNRKNGFSNFKFKQDRQFDSTLIQNYFYIDKERLNNVILDLLIFYNKKIENLDNEYQELQKLLKIYLFEKNFSAVSLISKQISLLLNIFKLIKISKLNLENTKIFTPHIICFRGRFYVLSDVSFTFNVEFRFCMYLGYYDDNFNKIEKKDDYSELIKLEILKYKNELQNCNLIQNLENYNELEIVSLLFLMINIAEYEKINLGREVTLLQFIQKGIQICNSIDFIIFDDVYDQIKVKYYIFILKEVLNKSKKKWLVSKDATASCCQHLIKILGASDNFSYKLCNLDSKDTWYDTYAFIIDNFLLNKIFIYLTNDDVKKWLSRKFLKKTIMTEAYGISFLNAKKEYFKNNQKLFLDELKLKELEKTFQEFFNYLEKNPLLFKQSPKMIINEIFDNDLSEIILITGESTNLKYFKQLTIQKSYYINNFRHTKQKQILSPNVNVKKMKRSLRANYVQLIESAVARHVAMKISTPIIHDCFTIDHFNVPYLLSVINSAMNIKFHDLNLNKEIFISFSIFVVL